MTAFIRAISYYLPPKVLDNIEINQKHPEWSIDKIAQKTGILSRHVTVENECSSDLAVEAAKKLFVQYNISPSEIDFILLCTQSPDYFLPTTACLIQDRLGIPTSVGALDFNLGCSGFVYGLSLAKGLIAGKMAKSVLLLTAETYSKYIKDDDKINKTIFGDGAAATLISADSGFCSIEKFCFGTDGRGSESLIVKTGGARNPSTDAQNFIYMNGPEIFNFALDSVPKFIGQVLEENLLSLEEVRFFILHQANQFMLESIRKIIGIPKDKFFVFLKECGNTVSSTIPIALSEAIQSGAIKKGEYVLIAGFGVGYSWAGNVLTFI